MFLSFIITSAVVLLFSISGAPVWLTFISMFACIFICAMVQTSLEEKNSSELNHEITFNKDTYTATLLKRSDLSANALKISPYHLSKVDYHPETLIYTGATVGGITTGGVHRQEAYYSQQLGTKTDRCFLYTVLPNKEQLLINKIILSNEEMISSAKAHPIINQFLNGNIIELAHKRDASEAEATVLTNAYRSGDQQTIALMEDYNATKVLLTNAECESVLSWVRGY